MKIIVDFLKTFRFAFFGSFAALSLAIAGCASAPIGSENNQPPVSGGENGDSETTPSETSGSSNNSGSNHNTFTMEFGSSIYSFTFEFCALGAEDALAHGPGYDIAGGETGYIHIDFYDAGGKADGEVRIYRGTTSQFSSPDEYFVFDTVYFAGNNTADMQNGSLRMSGDFRDQDLNEVGVVNHTFTC